MGEDDVEVDKEGDEREKEREEEEEREGEEMAIVGGDDTVRFDEEVAMVEGFGWRRHG